MLVTGHGLVGAFIRTGQWLNGDASQYTHAVLILNDNIGFEARPGGAGYVALSKYNSRKRLYSNYNLTPALQDAIVSQVPKLVGTPYSFLDYAALALHRLHIRPKFITDYITSDGHMICSQLVDMVYSLAGIHLFCDNRLPQDVTPGDLESVIGG